MSISRNLFLILFLLLVGSPLVKGQDLPSIRKFDEQKVEQLQADHPYEVAEPVPEGAFQRLWNRLKNWFLGFFASETTGDIINLLFKLLLLAVFVFFVIKLSGVEISSVFKPAKPNVSLEVGEEQLSEIDFDAAIAQARKSQDWRLTVRVSYLTSLKFVWEGEISSVR